MAYIGNAPVEVAINELNIDPSVKTGSGKFVLQTGASLVTPALGTPSSGTLTNCTGLPASAAGYIAAGTGASAGRSVQDKLRERVSVLDFIPVGTNTATTDCRASIQAAINAATSLKKILFVPSGNYLISGAGLSFLADFPGMIGEGIFKTVFYYNGTGTAIAVVGNSSLGVYRDWQVVAGNVGDSIATARTVARNGIYWYCHGGQGEVTNVKASNFNGFGMNSDCWIIKIAPDIIPPLFHVMELFSHCAEMTVTYCSKWGLNLLVTCKHIQHPL
jgi:hypothetical protein